MKRDEVNITDQEGYQLAGKLRRRSGHFVPEIFATDVDLVKESFAGGSLEPKSLEAKPAGLSKQKSSEPKTFKTKSLEPNPRERRIQTRRSPSPMFFFVAAQSMKDKSPKGLLRESFSKGVRTKESCTMECCLVGETS